MMKSQENGWLGNMLDWGRRRQLESSEILYGNAVELARDPAFFSTHGVADTVDGRFDALALVVALVMRRLKACGEDGAALSQDLFDSMFSDMDLSLREMGAGDIGVSKRVRVMAEAFMGRLNCSTRITSFRAVRARIPTTPSAFGRSANSQSSRS